MAALSEIAEASPHLQVMDMNSSTINKLLTALNECTEWGQVFILDCLSSYTPKDDREAQSTCERVTPRLAHANAAVVLSAVKVRACGVRVCARAFVWRACETLLPFCLAMLREG